MQLYTDKWRELSTADFIIGMSSCCASINFNTQESYAFNKSIEGSLTFSYDNNTGILTFSSSIGSYTTNCSKLSYQMYSFPQNVFLVWLGTVNGQ